MYGMDNDGLSAYDRLLGPSVPPPTLGLEQTYSEISVMSAMSAMSATSAMSAISAISAVSAISDLDYFSDD